MRVYKYMVIYNYKDGIGRICVTRNQKISSYDDIEEIDKFIAEKKGLYVVVVTDYKLLSSYKDDRYSDNAQLTFDMPECCTDCIVSCVDNSDHGKKIPLLFCNAIAEYCPESGRHKDCPIIELGEEN